MQRWLDILAALAEAQASVGIVPPAAAEAIRLHAKLELLDLEEVATENRESGHSTLGLIRCLRRLLPEHAREWVYYGATVQDLTDTWTALVMKDVCEIVLRDLKLIDDLCCQLAKEHSETLMCGRTHGQPGLPITFGFKVSVWAAEIRRHRERIQQSSQRFAVVQLAGALGTMEFWGEESLPLLAAFADALGLAPPQTPWLTARDNIAEFVCLMAMISATLGKIGQEVYELQRPEIGELREGRADGVVGSITMPHKRNPEVSEHLVTLSRLVRSAVPTVLEGMIAEHERDGRGWKSEWIVLPEVCQFVGASLSLGTQLLAELEINNERMLENLSANGGYVLSEPAMRALAPFIGKHAAHELVYEIVSSGQSAAIDMVDALRANSFVNELMTEEQLVAALDVKKALGAASAFVDRVCKDTEETIK